MNKDEIMQVLRLTAMGRSGHPMQEEFAQKLAALFETPEERAQREMGSVQWQCSEIVASGPAVMETEYVYSEAPVVIDDQTKPKRGPGRPKKAD